MVIIYTNGGALRLVPIVVCKGRGGGKGYGWREGTGTPYTGILNFGGRAASEPGDLDYTTVEQSAMTADDVYVLVVDANDNFLYQVQDLKLGNPVEGDNYYTRQLEGTMLRTVGGEQVKLVVLANLKDNKIASYTTGAAIRNFLETKKGSNIAKVYKELVYHYGGSTIPWKLAERAIPMWEAAI